MAGLTFRALASPLGWLYRFSARLVYLTLLLLFGLPFAVIKWVLVGTRGSRERRKQIRLEQQALKRR